MLTKLKVQSGLIGQVADLEFQIGMDFINVLESLMIGYDFDKHLCGQRKGCS